MSTFTSRQTVPSPGRSKPPSLTRSAPVAVGVRIVPPTFTSSASVPRASVISFVSVSSIATPTESERRWARRGASSSRRRGTERNARSTGIAASTCSAVTSPRSARSDASSTRAE